VSNTSKALMRYFYIGVSNRKELASGVADVLEVMPNL
jgi:hypothetical protein